MSVEYVSKEDLAKVEPLVMKAKKRVVEAGKTIAEVKKPGDLVQMKGIEKAELLHRGLATRDLEWKPEAVPPKAKQVPQTQMDVVAAQITTLVETVTTLVESISTLADAIAKKGK